MLIFDFPTGFESVIFYTQEVRWNRWAKEEYIVGRLLLCLCLCSIVNQPIILTKETGLTTILKGDSWVSIPIIPYKLKGKVYCTYKRGRPFTVMFLFCNFTERLKTALCAETRAWCVAFGQNCNVRYRTEMEEIFTLIEDITKRLSRPIKDLDDIRHAMGALKEIRDKEIMIDMSIGPIEVSKTRYLPTPPLTQG